MANKSTAKPGKKMHKGKWILTSPGGKEFHGTIKKRLYTKSGKFILFRMAATLKKP
jgi:hypothetical protein